MTDTDRTLLSSRRAAGLGALAVAAWIGGCRAGGGAMTGQPQSRPPIQQVLERHTDSLLSVPAVVGVAQGESGGRPVIQVLVVHRTPELEARLPRTLDGYPVVIVETGEIRALDSIH
jgi:hypothetical protein